MRRYVLWGSLLAIIGGGVFVYLQARSDRDWPVTLTDINRTRNLVSTFFLAHRGESPPVAADGRLDVYAAAGLLVRTQAQIDEFYRSERLGMGPTLAEVRAGDYSNFPYQRFKGTPSIGDPWLWDKQPVRGHRVIAFGGGRSALVDEQEARAILARAGQD